MSEVASGSEGSGKASALGELRGLELMPWWRLTFGIGGGGPGLVLVVRAGDLSSPLGYAVVGVRV